MTPRVPSFQNFNAPLPPHPPHSHPTPPPALLSLSRDPSLMHAHDMQLDANRMFNIKHADMAKLLGTLFGENQQLLNWKSASGAANQAGNLANVAYEVRFST